MKAMLKRPRSSVIDLDAEVSGDFDFSNVSPAAVLEYLRAAFTTALKEGGSAIHAFVDEAANCVRVCIWYDEGGPPAAGRWVEFLPLPREFGALLLRELRRLAFSESGAGEEQGRILLKRCGAEVTWLARSRHSDDVRLFARSYPPKLPYVLLTVP
jgi:hypothetical protein